MIYYQAVAPLVFDMYVCLLIRD